MRALRRLTAVSSCAVTGRSASDSDAEHRAAVSGAETIVRGLDSQVRGLEPDASGRATLIGDSDLPRADATLRRGVVLGRYIVLERIGAGAMGVVYAAYDPELDRKVALKLLRAESNAANSESVGRARLLREAQAMAKVSHPNVVTVHDVGEADVGGHGIVYLAMEFIVGASLFARLEAARVGRPQGHALALEWFIAAGRGLAAAHDAGLVHRDFKPENVMVGDDGRVRVLDFGLAHADLVGALAVVEATRGAFNPRLTETGVIMGTPFYMAPEQFAGAEIDARVDQFAFCASLYEAVYGERPFHGDSLASLARAVTLGVVRPPANRQVSGGLRRALLRGLAPRREDRWPSMHALLAALERLSSRRVVGTLAAVGVAVVGASVGLGLWLRDDPCAQAAAEMTEVWNPSRREAIERRAVGLYGAEELTTMAVGTLDDYARRWSDQRQDACLATRTRGTASEASLDLRYACLDRARVRFDGALTGLIDETTSPELLRRAPELVAGLGELAECEDLERLRAGVEPPRGPEATRAVDALRGELVASSTRAAAGQTADIAAEFEAHVAAAREIGYRPILAEALGMLGHSYVFTGRLDDARVVLDEGILIAEAVGDDAAIAKLLRELGSLEVRSSRLDVAEQHFRRGFAVLERMGSDDDAMVSGLHIAWARGKVSSGDTEGGVREIDAAIAALGERDSDDSTVLAARSMRADLLARIGQTAEAEREMLDVLERLRRAHGSAHPDVAYTLVHHARLLRRAGRCETALSELEQAHTLAVATLGATHNNVAAILRERADCELELGRLVEAHGSYVATLAILEANPGALRPREAADVHGVLGEVDTYRGEYEEALGHSTREVELLRAAGVDDAVFATAQAYVGLSLLELGREAEAREVLVAAEAGYIAQGDDPQRFFVSAALGELDRRAGDLDKAEARFAATAQFAGNETTRGRALMGRAAVAADRGAPAGEVEGWRALAVAAFAGDASGEVLAARARAWSPGLTRAAALRSGPAALSASRP